MVVNGCEPQRHLARPGVRLLPRRPAPLGRAGPSAPGGAILDVGAGTGRVAWSSRAAAIACIALDHDAELLGALRERAGDLDIHTVCADARSFALPRHRQAPPRRRRARARGRWRCASPRCRPCSSWAEPTGASPSCAAPARTCSPGACSPARSSPSSSPSTAPTVARGPRRRARWWAGFAIPARPPACSLAAPPRSKSSASAARAPRGSSNATSIELDRITIAELEREGLALGMHPERARHIPPPPSTPAARW